jgi:hypothetical protein
MGVRNRPEWVSGIDRNPQYFEEAAEIDPEDLVGWRDDEEEDSYREVDLKRIAKYTAWTAGRASMWHDYFPAAGWEAAPGQT